MNECPTGCGHNCLPSLSQMNMLYNRSYYGESELANKNRISKIKNPNPGRLQYNLSENYPQSRSISTNQITMKSNVIPGVLYEEMSPYNPNNPNPKVRSYEGYDNHVSFMKNSYPVPPSQGSPLNRRFNSVFEMDTSQLANSYVNFIPHSLPDHSQMTNEPSNYMVNKHGYYHHAIHPSISSFKNNMPMISERKIMNPTINPELMSGKNGMPIMMADPSLPYSPLVEYSTVNNFKGPAIVGMNSNLGYEDPTIPNIYDNNSLLSGKGKAELYHPVLANNPNYIKNTPVHAFVSNPHNDTSSYIENDNSLLETENPNEISNDSSFNNVVNSGTGNPADGNTNTNNNTVNNSNNLTVDVDTNRINLLSPSKTSIIKTLINSPSAAFSKLSSNANGFKNKVNKNSNNTGDNTSINEINNNNNNKSNLPTSISLLSKLNEKDSGGNELRKSPYLIRHHSAYNLNKLYSLNMTSTPDLSEVNNNNKSTGVKGKRRLRQSTSNINLGNSTKSLSTFNLSLKMSNKNDADNINNKKENIVKPKNVKKNFFYNRNDGIYGSL